MPELWTGDFDSVLGRAGGGLAGRAARGVSGGQGQDRRRAGRRTPRSTGAPPRWCWPAPSAARAPITPSCIWRWRCGWPRPGLPTLLTSGAQEGCPLLPGEASFDFAAGTLFSVLGFSDLTGPQRQRRALAARPRRRAVRLLAHHIQRGDRRARDRAGSRPRAAARASLPRRSDF